MRNFDEYITRAVAAAPQPTPELINELGRLLAPALVAGKGRNRAADVQTGSVAA